MPVTDVFYKRIISTWYEKGFLDAIEIAANLRRDEAPSYITFLASQLLKTINLIGNIKNAFYPRLRVSKVGKKNFSYF